MSLFTNPNFIDHIVKSQGGDQILDTQHHLSLQTLVEIQTRLLVQAAIKLMKHQRRDTLQQEDIETATKLIGHPDLIIMSLEAQKKVENEQISKQDVDPFFKSPQEFFKYEMKVIGSVTQQLPKMRGQWIYIKGKIPTTSENINLKCLSQLNIHKSHANEEQKKLYNIIKDDPFSLLTGQQQEYFKKVTNMIATNSNPTGNFSVNGDLNNLVPFFLKLLKRVQLNETAILFFLKLINNSYVSRGIDFHLQQCLAILLAYKGPHAQEVGIKLSELVLRFEVKYPILRDIFEGYQDQSYSTTLKKIPFELMVGVPFELSQSYLAKCKADAEYNDPIAILCMKSLLNNSSQLSMFRDRICQQMGSFIYWHPCPELKEDPFLRMF